MTKTSSSAEYTSEDSLPPLVIDFDPPSDYQSASCRSYFNENEDSLPPLVIDFDLPPHQHLLAFNSILVDKVEDSLPPLVIDFDPPPHQYLLALNSILVDKVEDSLPPLVIDFDPPPHYKKLTLEKNEQLTHQACIVKKLSKVELLSKPPASRKCFNALTEPTEEQGGNPLPLLLTFNQQAVFKTNMIKRRNRDWEVLSISNKIRPYWIEEHSESETISETPLTKKGLLRNIFVYKEIYFKVFSRKQDFVYYMDIYKQKTGRLCCSVGCKTNFTETPSDLKKEAKKAIKNWHQNNCKIN